MKKIILIIVLVCAYSCEKLIDVDVPNNQIDRQAVFQDLQTANSALAALYAGLMAGSSIAGADLEASLSVYTDDLDDLSTTVTPTKELYLNQQIDTNLTVYNNWANSYKHIYTANSILEGLSGSTSISKMDRKWLRGETLLIRTVLFYYLNQLFGDIPYPITTDYKVNQVITKTSSLQVLNKMEDDINEVIQLLSDNYRNAERIYPNRYAAKLLLAKIQLSKKEWNNAEITLNDILQSPLYQLETDITKVFQKNGKHIIWQLKPNNNASLPQATVYYFNNSKPNLYAATNSLLNSFSVNDQRKQQWLSTVSYNGESWYRVQKYKNRDNTNTNEYSIIFRLEEVKLLMAEALGQQNKIIEGLPYLNATRTRAGLTPLSNLNQATFLQETLLENRREFFTEMGHRFLDLKRMEKLNLLNSVKTNWQPYHERWPIPQKEILLNSNLKPQNTGY